jgi:hypothetical protein
MILKLTSRQGFLIVGEAQYSHFTSSLARPHANGMLPDLRSNKRLEQREQKGAARAAGAEAEREAMFTRLRDDISHNAVSSRAAMNAGVKLTCWMIDSKRKEETQSQARNRRRHKQGEATQQRPVDE